IPVQYGLYSSFMGCFVYCFLGTAKDVTLGPTAIMSLLVSSYAFHEPVYAILLAFLSGCIQLAMGLLHLGFLLDFISCPVIKGFTSAASITISFNQVKNILGLQGIPRQFFLQVYETLRRIGETRAGDAVLGVACLAALAGLRAMKSRLPRAAREEPLAARLSYLVVWTSATARNALVVLFAGLVAYSFQVMGSQPLTLTGSIPQGLPAFRLPQFSMAAPNGTIPFRSMVEDMGVGLAVVPLMGLLETVAIAKAFASQNDYRIDPNQELLALGFANLLGSFVSSYPVTGSFGRWVAGRGAKPQPAGCSLGLRGDGALQILGERLCGPRWVPGPVSWSPAALLGCWAVRRSCSNLPPHLAALQSCCRLGAVGWLVFLPAGLPMTCPPLRGFVQVSEGNVLLVQLGSSLHFPAVECLRDTVCSRALAASPPRAVVLDCCHISSIDYTVVVGLAELRQELRKHGLSLAFCSLQDPVLKVLLSADLEGFQHFPSREEA
ncbi:S2611 protein, partial [Glareola pratincola]|nr:S2611 protein [Glareola pratincola]